MIFPRPAVSAIIIKDKKLLLVKRGCEPNLGKWSLPGGSIEPGETARKAIAREVLEETSLVIKPENVATVYDVIQRDNGEIKFHYVIICFFTSIVSGELKADSDAADARWIAFDDLETYNTTSGLIELIKPLL